jgi:hypothetical protein
MLLYDAGKRLGAHLEGAAQVHCDHLVPHLLVHVDERFVPQDTRVGNEDVHGAKRVRRCFDNGVAFLGRANGGYSLTSDCTRTPVSTLSTLHAAVGPLTRLDLLHDLLGTLLAHVVDHHVGPELAEHEGIAPPESSPGAGNDDGLALEFDRGRDLRVGRGRTGLLQ